MRQPWGEVLSALGATLAMLLPMSACRFTLGTPLLPELISQRIFALVTPQIAMATVRHFGLGTKWIVFGLVVAGYSAAGVGLGRLYAAWLRRQGYVPSLLNGCLFGVLVWGLLMTLGMPLLGVGLFGRLLRHGAVSAALVLLALHLLYGGMLAMGLRYVGRQRLPSTAVRLRPTSRRLFLRELLFWPMLWGSAYGLWRPSSGLGLCPATAAANDWTSLQGAVPEITPVERFYTVSKNLFEPTIAADAWTLNIHGLVDRPLQFSLPALQALPAYSAYVTFVCISNEIGGQLIGNALWQGVRLRTLLEQAVVKPQARKVVLRSEDGYSTAVPLARCLQPETFLAYAMNGRALPTKHGFPLRAVIPGYYGMKQPKWLTEIELVADDYQGYWEARGWADEAQVKTMSRLDVPTHRGQFAQPEVALGGIAFAGERGIDKVEFSGDGGKTWQEAVVKPALSPFAWSLWRGTLLLPRIGAYLLAVRAVDGRGNVQEERVSEPLPDGASGYHKIRLIRKAE